MMAWQQSWLFATAIVICIAGLGMWETLRPARSQAETRTPRRFVNFALAALHLSLVLALPLTQISAAASAKAHGFGLLNFLAAPSVATFAVTVVLASLIAYLTHIILHRAPLFWRFHAIHHNDDEIDASTALRHHPGEILLIAAIQIPVIVLLGLDPTTLAFLYVCEWLHGLFAHANARLPQRVDKALGYVLVTPAMHAVHHSAYPKESDSNYGTMFSGWDRLFGTFHKASDEAPKFGLGAAADSQDAGPIQVLRTPFLAPLR